MPSIVVRLLLFLSSYFPLAAIVTILFYDKHPRLAIGAITVSGLGLLGMLLYLHSARKLAPIQLTITRARRMDMEAMSYMVTYVIPFMAVPSDSSEKQAALLLFFVVLAVLYINSNMIHINPMLNVFRYHLYEVTTADGSDQILITRTRVRTGARLQVARLDDDLLIEK
ncbi:MAG TPA: hypothetical protein VHW24_26110 [Bryobacteraceae bacterium]|jgi:hypothetical protein|nr:hypothetical protein [Bryobacteraceae bacterium]